MSMKLRPEGDESGGAADSSFQLAIAGMQGLSVMKKLVVAAVVIASAVLSACVTTNATLLDAASAEAPTDPASVKIYLSETDIPGSYRRLAVLNALGDSTLTNHQKMYDSMRRRAAGVGANGILLVGTKEPSTAARVISTMVGVGAQREGFAVAIVVEGEPRVPAPPSRR